VNAISPVDGLAQLSFLVQGTLERRAAGHDISIVQTRLLGILRDRRPTMNELAKLLGLDKSSVTGLVDRAERRGLVARVPSEADRRSVLVSLTEQGRALTTSVSADFASDMTSLLALLPTADQAALSSLISRLLVAHANSHGVDLFDTVDQGLSAPARRSAAG
jgi:MarR family transcriptional regulator, lower aerobic nicotinate degradation pathway regulator